MSKIGCIVQGNVRNGLQEVLTEIGKHFDPVIFSTWREEKSQVPAGSYELVLSERPANTGVTNRNMQRIGTSEGLKCAESLGCEYVLKWRTDLLPTAMDRDELLRAATERVPADVPSRIVMSAFRNLSVRPDWFSSLPDMYAFGHIKMMKLLWNYEQFDSTKSINVPQAMQDEQEIELTADDRILLAGEDVTEDYDAHLECYALFKDNLQHFLGRNIEHGEMARDYLALLDHRQMKICWFRAGEELRFRPMGRAFPVPWLSEPVWRSGILPEAMSLQKRRSLRSNCIERICGSLLTQCEFHLQKRWLKRYRSST